MCRYPGCTEEAPRRQLYCDGHRLEHERHADLMDAILSVTQQLTIQNRILDHIAGALSFQAFGGYVSPLGTPIPSTPAPELATKTEPPLDPIDELWLQQHPGTVRQFDDVPF